MRRQSKSLFFLMGILIFIYSISGCIKDRQPTNPQQYETRRPEIAYMIPADGDTVATDSIVAYFDELMNQTSVNEKFSVSLVVDHEPWTQLTSVAALAQSKTNPGFFCMARRERGAFFSENGGESWKFAHELSPYTVFLLRVDPENESFIYAITDNGLMKSSDRGVAWQRIHHGLPEGTSITGLDFDPANSAKIWLGTNFGIYYSTDAGQTWVAGGSLPSWRDDKDIVKIAVDPSNSSVVYAATLGRFIYKSVDDGITWEMIRGETATRLGASSIYDIVVDPENSTILYAATINTGIYKSTDTGANWRAVNEGLTDMETRKIVLNPVDNTQLFVATSTELFVSSDSAATWSTLPSPAPGSSILELILDPQDAEQLALIVPNNIYFSENAGESWEDKNSIDPESISFNGTFAYEEWADTLQFVDEEGERVAITPFRDNDILAAYDAGLRSEPPEDVDPNPTATKMTFTPDADFPAHWMYRIVVSGAFDAGTLRESYGARDIHGMSLEFDYISYFIKK